MPKLVALDLPGGELFVSHLQRVWEQGDAILPLDQRLPLKIRRELVSTMGASLVLSADSEQKFSGRSVEAGDALIYTYDTKADRTGITSLLNDVASAGLVLADVSTRQSSLEDIFVGLVSGEKS